jgi:hypothetical protein
MFSPYFMTCGRENNQRRLKNEMLTSLIMAQYSVNIVMVVNRRSECSNGPRAEFHISNLKQILVCLRVEKWALRKKSTQRSFHF